ncbi:DNA repair protein RecN [Xanthomarina sp. F2636L]|uniref:DNA repair protein RecN n=1 Tax=Xanthomarina sp. F2636L TaxID=2996018 RepID=UPI00225E5D47|nr:DNA repair protein RecN [Xanthomarina sp. F2636L]MCX7552189.1 DNA repair protein RecN [Xanthomarina sp. F2636L]
MITSLSIKNYALIDSLQVQFNQGFSIITGETGAGKSILLGGLSLILGKRADLSSIKDASKKCIIEAVFDVTNYHLKSLFDANDLDYEPQTIVRREILPSGKSRAFINDSPVNLSTLQLLGEQLIDIHSQHETLQLVDDSFQFEIIDALAKNNDLLNNYTSHLKQYKLAQKELDVLLKFKAEAIKEYDYNTFLLKELTEANLVDGELVSLEEEFETLNNIEEIRESLSHSTQLVGEEEIGILSLLTQLKSNFKKISAYANTYQSLFERIDSSFIELDDVFAEMEKLQEQLDADPERLEKVNSKLLLLNNLFKKHLVSSVSELILIRESLSEKVSETENLDDRIQKKEKELKVKNDVLNKLSKELHDNRIKAIPELATQLEDLLKDLGMPNAKFQVSLKFGEAFYSNGKDVLSFLFTANKGGQFNELKKAASGGELSRIMLAIKSILSKYKQLPTIMFDEIDSGVSGEISNKMGQIMLQMSQYMQVFAITHIPQIAAKGHTHFKVFKEDVDNITLTNLKKLNHDERLVEIAQMLGGIEISSSAMAHAKQLLN